jgi:hypothetical protein
MKHTLYCDVAQYCTSYNMNSQLCETLCVTSQVPGKGGVPRSQVKQVSGTRSQVRGGSLIRIRFAMIICPCGATAIFPCKEALWNSASRNTKATAVQRPTIRCIRLCGTVPPGTQGSLRCSDQPFGARLCGTVPPGTQGPLQCSGPRISRRILRCSVRQGTQY